MSAELTQEQIAEDLPLAAELGGEWDYGFDGTNVVARHYNDEGQFDKTLILHITFEEK